jgi:trimethylamine--corrinoid protein Co-methyltransferase
MKLTPMQVLSDAEIQQIHEASVTLLAETGVRLGSAAVCARLAERGLPVDSATRVAHFPAEIIENALSAIPPRFDVYDREGAFAFCLGDGQTKIAAGHNAVFWVDSQTGKTRPSTVADVAQFARLCEQLPGIHMIGIPVMPQDVPVARASLLHGIRACLINSRKPIFFSTDNPAVNRAAIAMLQAAYPGDLRRDPCGISQLSPTSPLTWEGPTLDALADTVDLGVPLAVLPEPNAGVSSPYSLAGLVTLNNAECLSGLVMAQLLSPGARVMYANSWTFTDMRDGSALVGSVETGICRIAGAQLARFYAVPSHTTAPNSDNHAHDEQNAWEKSLGTLCAVAAGNDLIVNCGMFATGMTCSHEQLLMDEEMCAMCAHITAGMRVDKDSIAADLIAALGPGQAKFLTADHTLARLRTAEFLPTALSVRGPRSAWEAAGALDTYALARRRVQALSGHPGAPLDATRAAAVDEVIADFQRA